jgi:precorrin-4 methylase
MTDKIEEDKIQPKVVAKKRGEKIQKPEKKSFLENIIGDSNLEITIKIPEEDKKAITETLQDVKETMDNRWKITQQLIIMGMILNASSYIISNLFF